MSEDINEIIDLIRPIASSLRHSYPRFDLDELVNEGYIAYRKFSGKYNPERGTFKRYARNKVKWGIMEYIREQYRRQPAPSQIESYDDSHQIRSDDIIPDFLAYDIMDDVLIRLPKAKRLLFNYCALHGPQKAAEILGVTVGNISQLFPDIKKKVLSDYNLEAISRKRENKLKDKEAVRDD